MTMHGQFPPYLSTQPVTQESTWWLQRHEDKLLEKDAMKRVDLVFLGDSITHSWETGGACVWDEYYQSRRALNLGFNGDRTEHVLWRLMNGEIDHIQPKLVVLLIGTNNTGHRMDPAEETALGVESILSVVKRKLPNTVVLLLAIFPRSAKPNQRLRKLNDEVNQKIRLFEDKINVFFLNINHLFIDEKGELSSNMMLDFLHPSDSQYQRIAEALEPMIARFLDDDSLI